MASPQAEQILSVLRQLSEGLTNDLTIPEMRAAAESFGSMTGEPEGIKTEIVDVAGREAMWVIPEDAHPDKTFLYLHGGGLVSGSIHSYERLVGHLARAAGMRALSLNYRLAPENPFPAALDDSLAAYEWLLANGFAAEGIALCGDSSGGGLALALVLRLKGLGRPMPAGVLALSPNADATCSGETWSTNAATDLMLKVETIRGTWSHYLMADIDPKDPAVSPVFGDFSGAPPIFIQVGGAECLLDDARRVAARATEAGVDVTLEVAPEMQHVFQLWAGNVPEADDAVTRAGAWLRSRL